MISTSSSFRTKLLSLSLNISLLFLITFLIIYSPNTTSTTTVSIHSRNSGDTKTADCTALHLHPDYRAKCLYVKSHTGCQPKGYINYLKIFYCSFGHLPLLGYALLLLWLIVLFYTLGNTASDYFCPSLESLSKTLKLPPAIAGTTLLPFGNGSNDVFASIISFTSSSDADIGLNSVLGGAFFISSIVVGALSILIASRQIVVDKSSFIRDVLFLLFSLFALSILVFIGRITLLGAIFFSSFYILYISVVCAMHFLNRGRVNSPPANNNDIVGDIRIPLLGCIDEEKCSLTAEKKDFAVVLQDKKPFNIGSFLLIVLELPLYLPRRLTIPVVSKERWSKPFAVISIALAPTMLALVWNTPKSYTSSRTSREVIFIVAAILGLVLGIVAFTATKVSRPPQTCVFPWLACGFLMSITWTYITAKELVSLLESLGYIIGISPSILGLTVLAWGNSLGDFITNVAIGRRGGRDGAQIAVSGCYAGPVFNVLVGIGLSLVFGSWSQYPSPYVIDTDEFMYETIGFLMAGLLWALVILPKNGMRLDQTLGGGLIVIYSCFLFIKLSRALGLLKLSGSFLPNLNPKRSKELSL